MSKENLPFIPTELFGSCLHPFFHQVRVSDSWRWSLSAPFLCRTDGPGCKYLCLCLCPSLPTPLMETNNMKRHFSCYVSAVWFNILTQVLPALADFPAILRIMWHLYVFFYLWVEQWVVRIIGECMCPLGGAWSDFQWLIPHIYTKLKLLAVFFLFKLCLQ